MLTKAQIREISDRALEKRHLLGLGPKSSIGGKVFSLLDAQRIILFRFPVNDLELAALIGRRDDHTFVFVNTLLAKGKQNFAAAHELAHAWFHTEVLQRGGTICNISEDNSSIPVEEYANRFSAEFLVPGQGIMSVLEGLPDQFDWLCKTVVLSNYFEVPTKTIVRRLVEEGLVSSVDSAALLDAKAEVIRERRESLGLPTDLEEPTKDRSVSVGFRALVLDNYRNGRISEGKKAQLDELMDLQDTGEEVASESASSEDQA